VALLRRIDGQHGDLADSPVSVREPGDHKSSKLTLLLRNPGAMLRMPERIAHLSRLMITPVLAVEQMCHAVADDGLD
jgi:hypothetical protein